MFDPLGVALTRLVELEDSPRGLLGSPAALVAVYDGLQAAAEDPAASVAALSFAQSALNAFRDAAAAVERRDAECLARRGRAYLVAAVQTTALQN